MPREACYAHSGGMAPQANQTIKGTSAAPWAMRFCNRAWALRPAQRASGL